MQDGKVRAHITQKALKMTFAPWVSIVSYCVHKASRMATYRSGPIAMGSDGMLSMSNLASWTVQFAKGEAVPARSSNMQSGFLCGRCRILGV